MYSQNILNLRSINPRLVGFADHNLKLFTTLLPKLQIFFFFFFDKWNKLK